ncbi:MAG: hypothetical protein RJA36_3415 [Pseudomonadota bacterium]|jgi:predicted secreted protein
MTQEYTRDQARIAVNVGEQFSVSLAANPTTGHEWQPAFDLAWLVLLGREFTPPGSALGEGGSERFRFQAQAAGTTRLRFAYRRPWESGAPADEAEFEVAVA